MVHFKVLMSLVLAFLTSTVSLAQPTQGAPTPRLTFSGTTYHMVWCADPTPAYKKCEYLPKGQALSNYRNMVLVEQLSSDMTVSDVVRRQVAFLRQRQQEQNDPVANHRVLTQESTGEFLLDFVLSGRDANDQVIVEWNAYRYIPTQGADGKKGVLLYGYSARGYGDEGGRDFLIALKEERPHIVQMLSTKPPAFSNGAARR